MRGMILQSMWRKKSQKCEPIPQQRAMTLNQGEGGTCTIQAVANAVCEALHRQGHDIRVKPCVAALLQFGDVVRGNHPTELDGKEIQMMDEQSLGYGNIRIKVTNYRQECDYSPDAEYVLVYQMTKQSETHCVYIKNSSSIRGQQCSILELYWLCCWFLVTSYLLSNLLSVMLILVITLRCSNPMTSNDKLEALPVPDNPRSFSSTYNCLNSHGLFDPEPTVPVDKEGNMVYKVDVLWTPIGQEPTRQEDGGIGLKDGERRIEAIDKVTILDQVLDTKNDNEEEYEYDYWGVGYL